MNKRIFVSDETAMQMLGKRIANLSKPGEIIFLQGNLGAGKTTLIRGFLRYFGITGPIKSPTFTLVETYQTKSLYLFHFDLYRIKQPNELLEIGLTDYFTEDAICLIEWPEKAIAYLPNPSQYWQIEIPDKGEGRWVIKK